MSIIESKPDEQISSSGWTNAIAVLMIVLGFIAIAFPFFATVATTLAFGWVFTFTGITQIVYASSTPLSSVWLIGTLIGVNLLSDGVWMLTLHSEQQQYAK
jgi:uncharacterized membrane protein HdeD (DUF308 family)